MPSTASLTPTSNAPTLYQIRTACTQCRRPIVYGVADPQQRPAQPTCTRCRQAPLFYTLKFSRRLSLDGDAEAVRAVIGRLIGRGDDVGRQMAAALKPLERRLADRSDAGHLFDPGTICVTGHAWQAAHEAAGRGTDDPAKAFAGRHARGDFGAVGHYSEIVITDTDRELAAYAPIPARNMFGIEAGRGPVVSKFPDGRGGYLTVWTEIDTTAPRTLIFHSRDGVSAP